MAMEREEILVFTIQLDRTVTSATKYALLAICVGDHSNSTGNLSLDSWMLQQHGSCFRNVLGRYWIHSLDDKLVESYCGYYGAEPQLCGKGAIDRWTLLFSTVWQGL